MQRFKLPQVGTLVGVYVHNVVKYYVHVWLFESCESCLGRVTCMSMS